MISDRFADRLDAARYQSDEVVGIYGSTPDDPDALWLSERLVRRLALIASAYELHVLPRFIESEPVQLNRQLCATLVDELEFIAARLDDELVTTTAEAVRDYATARVRRPSWSDDVTFDGN